MPLQFLMVHTCVRRDDLLTVQADGLKGSAVAGLRECYIQPAEATPKAVWKSRYPTAYSLLRFMDKNT
jgi:hypothetical protein